MCVCVSADNVREPAAYHGLHAIRPTFGSASLEGVKVNSPRYDAVELLGRSLKDLVHVAKHSLDIPGDGGTTLPRRIIYPVDFFPLPDASHQKLVDEFVEKLEGHLGVGKTEVSLAQSWHDKPPSESFAAGRSLQDYLKKAPFWSLCYEFYQATGQFRTDYRDTFDKEPFIEASPSFYLDTGANITEDEYKVYLAQLETFKTWFDRTIMSLSHGQSDDAIMILPCGTEGSRYRDMPPDEPAAIEGVSSKFLSPILGTPHIVVPFAQLPYKSRVTKTVEYRPVCISLMGSRGSDLALLRVAEEVLQAAGWRTGVDTGRFTFPVGNNSRHVQDDGVDGSGQGADVPVEPHASSVASTPGDVPDEL